MRTLFFIVPAAGRVDLARVCLRQLRRTCDELADHGIIASAVVIADDENLGTARDLGFGTVERDNVWLGRKFNDGYELAASAGIDYVVPLGSDDWIDAAAIGTGDLREDTIRCFRLTTFVREDGGASAPLRIPYDGGVGVRVI